MLTERNHPLPRDDSSISLGVGFSSLFLFSPILRESGFSKKTPLFLIFLFILLLIFLLIFQIKKITKLSNNRVIYSSHPLLLRTPPILSLLNDPINPNKI